MSLSVLGHITVRLSRDTYLGTRVSVSFGTHHGSLISGHLPWDTYLCQFQDIYHSSFISGHLSWDTCLSVSGHLSRFLHLVTLMLMLGHASQSYIPGQISRLTYIGTCIMRHVSWDTYLRTRILDTYLRSFISRGIRYGIHYSAQSSRDIFLGRVSRDMCRDMCHGTRAPPQVSWDTFLDHLSRDTYLD